MPMRGGRMEVAMKKCISLWLAIVLLFSLINIPVFAEEKKEGQIYFSYTDIETGEKVDNDRNLINGKYYKLSVEMSGVKELYAFQVPLHFNNEVVKLVNRSDLTEINDGVIPEDYKSDIYKSGAGCLLVNYDSMKIWKGSPLFNNKYPYCSNKEGLIKLAFMQRNISSDGVDWDDRAEIFSVTFKTIANGSTDFRPATKDDEYFDPTSENGFILSKVSDAEGEYWAPTVEEKGEKDVCTPISSIALSPKVLSVNEGESEKINVKLNDGSLVSQVVWTVDDPTVASVSQDGTVSGKKQGKTIITASNDDGTISDSCEVTVVNPNFPTLPKNLHIEEKMGKSVSLAWSPSTGRKGVTGYKIYRNGTFLANTTDTKFSDDGLTKDTEYKYTVSAYYQNIDELYESDKSEELAVVPKAPKITAVKPAEDSAVGGNGKVQIKVLYGDDFNSNGACVKMEYFDDDEVYRDVTIKPESIRENGENGFSFYPDFTIVTTNGQNDFRFTVTDKDGFSSDEVVVTYDVDTMPPSQIKNFKATNNIEREIYLSWDRAKEIDTAGYYLYKYDKDPTENNLKKSDAAKITISGIDSNDYTDKEIDIDKKYYYRLSAFDNFGQESDLTAVVTGMAIEDITPPTVLSILPGSNQKLYGKENKLEVSFYDNTKTTKAELEYYNAKDNEWKQLETKNVNGEKATFIIDSTKFDADSLVTSDDRNIDGILRLRVKAYDAAGNTLPEDKIEPVREYRVDNKAPETPKDINGEVKDLSATIRWDEDFMSKSDFGYFIVEQQKSGGKWTRVGGNIKDVAGLIVENLEYNTSYIYRVAAVDDCGNMSGYSDELLLTTPSEQDIRNSDSEKPVVVDIQPASGMLKNGSVTNVVVNAKDNIEVAKILLQYNIGEGWKDLDEIRVDSPSPSVTASKEINFYEINDLLSFNGWVKVRAVAYDQNGNKSAFDSNTVYREYGIDRIAPVSPSGLSAVLSDDGSVYVKWDVLNDDLNYYIVERSESKDFANVETVRGQHRKISCYDDTAVEGKSYYYRVCAVDNAGNKGAYAVTDEPIAIPTDNNPPEIISIRPENNSYINNDKNIVVMSKDQSGIKSVLLEYGEDGSSWSKYGEMSSDIAAFKSIGLKDGQYKFRATVTDKKDNSTVSDIYTYIIDNIAPVIKNEKAQTKGDDIIVNWSCSDSKLYKQSVYYKTQDSNYILAADRAPDESGNYEAVISGVEKYNNTVYSVKITAEDEAGNVSERIIEDVKFDGYTKDTVKPVISAVIPSVMIVGQEEYFDASKSYDNTGIKDYTWKFGTDAPITVTNPKYSHKFDKAGRYTVKLTVKDFAGNTSEISAKVKVVEKTDAKTLNLRIIDDTGVPVPNADVVLGYGTENSTKYKSDASGRCSIKLDKNGAYCIGVYQDGYLPTAKTINVYKNSSEEVIRLVKQNIVIGELTWHRMTLKEIEESGIDVSDVRNNNVFEYKISLIVGGEEVKANGIHVKDEKEHKPIVIDRTYSSPSGGTVNSKIYWFDFTEDGDFNGNDYTYNSETDKDKKPKAFIAYIETPGTASWLKEFFDVQLVVENQALPEFVLKDCTATLNIDDGLTVTQSTASGASSEKTVKLGDIAGQKKASARWILRGDKEGTYDISADFNGYFEGFDRNVPYTFESKEPIRVYGTDGLRFVVECEDEISDTDDYMLRIGLKNSGGISRYNAKVSLSESESLAAVGNYQNYIERENSTRFANKKNLELSETVYSNYAVSNEYSKQLFTDNKVDKAKLKGLVVQWLGGNVNLPVEVRTAKIRSFHNKNIEVFYKHDDGTLEVFNALQVYGGDMNIVVKTSETLPGKIEAQPAAGVDIYLDNKKIGTTNDDGTLEYVYNADPGNEKQKAVTLTFKGNRTEPYAANLQIINNKASVSGYVYDELGNPLMNARVGLIQSTEDSVLTDRNGYFKFDGMYDPSTARITIEKSGYQLISESIILTSGDVSLSYNLKRVSSKPKVLGANLEHLGKIKDNAIIPQGFDLEETISVNAEIASGTIKGYIMKIVDESGAEKISESEKNTFDINFKDLKAGDKICVYAKNDADAVSAPYYLPITVTDSPFVNLFNKNKNNFYIINGVACGQVTFDKLYDGAWLNENSEEEKAWNELLSALKQEYYIRCGGGYANIDSDTDINIDLFAYKDFPVNFVYRFGTGKLTINHQIRNYRIFKNNTNRNINFVLDKNKPVTGYFKFDETITNQSDLGDGRTMWLTAWNGTGWGLSGTFGVDFALNKDNKWVGSFGLDVDEDKEYNGTYYRVMEPYENIFKTFIPIDEVLTGTWNKTMTADTNQDIALTQNGVKDADDFTMKYNTSTQGTWRKGNVKISLCSESTNNITMLPQKKISGHTRLIGDYSIFGWKQGVDEYYNHTFGGNTALKSMAYSLLDNADATYEPVALLNTGSGGGGGASGGHISRDENTVKSNVFANAEIEAKNINGKLTAFYLDNGEGRAAVDSSKMSLLQYDNGVWTEASWLPNDDGTADYNPSLTQTKDGMIAVWTNADTKHDNSDGKTWTAEDIAEAARNMEICASVYDGHEWSQQEVIGQKGSVNYSPVVAEYNGGAVAAWIVNEENSISGDSSDAIMYSVYSGGEWSQPQALPVVNGAISNISMREYDGKLYVLYGVEEEVTLLDDNGEPLFKDEQGDAESRKINKYKLVKYDGTGWTTEQRIVGGDVADVYAEFAEIGSRLQILALSGMEMYRIDAETKKVEDTVSFKDLRDSLDVKLVQDGNNIALVWVSSGNNGPMIFASLYDEQHGWSEAVQLSAKTDSESVINNISPMFTQDGSLKVLYNRYMYTGDTSVVLLCETDLNKTADPEIISLTVENEKPMPNGTLELNAEIRNGGIEPVDLSEYTVVLKNKDNSNILTEAALDGTLAPGKTYSRTIKCVWDTSKLPEGNISLIGAVTANGGASELSTSECKVNLKDIAVDEDNADYEYTDGKHRFTVTVGNNGTVPTGKATVSAKCGDEIIKTANGDLSYEIELSCGDTKALTFETDSDIIGKEIVVTAELNDDETDKANNTASYTFKKKDVSTIRAKICEFNGDGTAQRALKDALIKVEVNNEEWSGSTSDKINDDKTADKSANVVKSQNAKVTITGDNILDRTFMVNSFDDVLLNDGKATGVAIGDVFKDNRINVIDYCIMLRYFGSNTKDNQDALKYDFNGDGVVNSNDLLGLIRNIGMTSKNYD